MSRHVSKIPYALLTLYVVGVALLAPENDLTRFFVPAGHLLLKGDSPYILNQTYPFIYWPLGLWIFPLLALLPAIYYIMLAVNALALVGITRRLNVSGWWCVYPPGLYTLLAGQLDLMVMWLAVEAYLRRTQIVSSTLMAAAIAVKPQIAAFWLLPWLWGMPDNRQRAKAAGLCGALLAVPLLAWWLLESDTVTALWQEWLAAVRNNSRFYIGDSPSLWAAGAPLLALAALALWLVVSRDVQFSRPLLALGLPALRYYSSIALLGAVPAWGVALGFVSVGLTMIVGQPVFWVEPLAMVAYHAWQRRAR